MTGRLVVLASGSGSNLQALLDACARAELPAAVVAVVSDRADAFALERARRAGVAAEHVPLADRRDPAARAAFDARLADAVAAHAPDLVVLAGWMLLLGPGFLDRFPGRVLNVHPALLPDDDGPMVGSSAGPVPALRGAHAVRDALRAGLPVTGATVHVVTPVCDVGPVLAREEVAVLPGDDEATLHARIKAVEHRLLPAAVRNVLEELAERPGASRAAAGGGVG